MDLSFLALQGIFGKEPQKIVRIFILRMWVGYCFDAGEIAFLRIHDGITFISDTWRYVFYGYCGFLGFMAFNLTFTLIQCIIGRDLRRYKVVPYLFAYFKLTSAVNAGFVFFQLWNSGNRDRLVIKLMVYTGIDIGFDLIQMGLGFAGLDAEKMWKRQVQIAPVTDVTSLKKY